MLEKSNSKLQMVLSYFLVAVPIFLMLLFFKYAFAVIEPVSSIVVQSTTLNYAQGEEGSWQYTKSAYWISKEKARINIKLESLEKTKTDYTDVILVLDTSGSMVKDKMEQLQSNVNKLINDTISKGNKIALITFNDTATIVNDFTDDTVVLQESINNLTASGETNYYQALVKVDEVLSTYNKEANRGCVVLFLTDGLPTTETPSEVGEYKLLKEKYDYLCINGIQYELDDKVLDCIKNITDIQFIANTKTLNEILYKVSISPAGYDKFILTDYIDSSNFNLKDVAKVSTTFGSASIEENQVIWNLDGFKTGLNAELIIDINLNNDLIGVGGVYPTHTKTDVSYKIESINATESSTKTTILKDNYVVTYEANTPTGCVVSGIPSSKAYSVFDTVRLDDYVPTCRGYQFKEWKIVTDGVEKIGNNQFVMLESNVIIKAIWKNVELAKSMNGKISKVQTLYKLMADNSRGVDTNIDFSKSSTDSDSGIYTMNSTKNDKYPVHYYRGNIENNNIMFANFCWKMVRTTSTGGVKIVYNGVPADYSESTSISQDKYVNILNDETYPYIYDLTTNKWTSTNKTNSTTGTISFSVTEPDTYVLSYSVSSEAKYDKAYFYKDGTQIGIDSGTSSGTISLGELTKSNVIMVKYIKDGSGSSGSDSVSFSIGKMTGKVVKTCNQGSLSSSIASTAFNSNSSSPAAVGYMYGTRYNYGGYGPASVQILNQYSTGSSSNYYYGDSITYADGSYTLTNVTQKTWSSNYSKLKGYYTCRNEEISCSTVYYIVNTSNSFQYVLPLYGGVIDPATFTITLGKGVADNGDGTYTLLEPEVIKKTDWNSNYSKYKEYYTCRDLTSTTCENKNLVISTNFWSLSYDRTFKFVYGNDVSWDGTKYILIDTFVSTNSWDTDKNTLSKKYHYTCLNTTGECTKVYYIHYFYYSSYIMFLTLSGGKDIEMTKDEMFANINDSAVKKVVDSWYKTNMIQYTEKLEDTVWCNDRTLYKGSLAGKNFDGGASYFSAYNRTKTLYSPSIVCPNQKRDGFTVSTSSGGNGALTYPVGLLTADEIVLMGGKGYSSSWSMSPAYYYDYGNNAGNFYYSTSKPFSTRVDEKYGVQPAVSLISGTKSIDGDGTADNPYVIGDE